MPPLNDRWAPHRWPLTGAECTLSETVARDILEIIHSRHKQASIIFSSQFEPLGWLGKFPEATIADAVLDRIVHDSYTIEIRSADRENQTSMREVYGLQK